MIENGNSAQRSLFPAAALLSILTAGLILYVSAFHPPTARAQGGFGWTTPTMLYDEQANSYKSALAADPFGAAHLVWADPDEPTYYYSRWDGSTWTAPVDVIARTGSAEQLGPPALVAGDDGMLHLFWTANSVMYSWAWGDAGDSARAWLEPEVVVVPSGFASGPMDAAQDEAGGFHLVYSLGQQDVYYLHEGEQGTWSAPSKVSQVAPGTSASAPRLAIGPKGTVHVVWNEWPVATGPAQENQIFYARSTDGGASWSIPRQLGGLADAGGNVLAGADGSVYLAWQAGIASPSQGRFLQRSTDGGTTWEAPVNFSTVKAQSGYPGLALDSARTLHVITGDGEYVWWDGKTVSPAIDLRPLLVQTENARLAVVAGNQVLAVIAPFYEPGIYSSVRQLTLPALPTAELPVQPSAAFAPLASATAVVTATPQATATTAAANAGTSLPGSPEAPTVPPLLLGSGLSLALVVSVFVAQWSRRRR